MAERLFVFMFGGPSSSRKTTMFFFEKQGSAHNRFRKSCHPLYPDFTSYRVDTINYGIFLPLYAAGHDTLERQSTQSASSIQQ